MRGCSHPAAVKVRVVRPTLKISWLSSSGFLSSTWVWLWMCRRNLRAETGASERKNFAPIWWHKNCIFNLLHGPTHFRLSKTCVHFLSQSTCLYVCLCPLLPGGRVQMCPRLQCTGFQSSIEKRLLNEVPLTCTLLLFLINTAWRVELLFDCGVTVVTCCLTFDSLWNERFVLPKWHFNKRWWRKWLCGWESSN